jgi:hypothetical protein
MMDELLGHIYVYIYILVLPKCLLINMIYNRNLKLGVLVVVLV